MILYHGSTDIVEKPEIRKSSSNLDFGDGFYLTTSFEQAERWAKVKTDYSHHSRSGVLSTGEPKPRTTKAVVPREALFLKTLVAAREATFSLTPL